MLVDGEVDFHCELALTTMYMYSGTPLERPPLWVATPLERPLDNVNLNINVLISTPDERPPLLKGHFYGARGVALQEGFLYLANMLWRPS